MVAQSSTENERSTVVITTPSGHDVLVRQVAGAVARRIVTYAAEEQTCRLTTTSDSSNLALALTFISLSTLKFR